MDITFRSVGPWGAGKGANLEAVEVDNNFWSIAEAIIALQNDPSVPVGISSITVAGTQMTITLTDGTVMGPYTLPVLTFRWRGEWAPATSYAVLDVFSVTDLGIYMVQIAHTSAATFDPDPLLADGTLLQLFGSTNAKLSGLSDVLLTSLADLDFLRWVEADAKWENIHLGTMAYQEADAVAITGGTITGMPPPTNPSDVATKAYADSLPAGMTAPDKTMMANISGVVAPAVPNTLSAILDSALSTTARGSMLYRSATGWVALAPGISGYFLQTLGAGADPLWTAAGAGVTSLTAGAGIDTTPDNIIGAGTVALAAIADANLLANVSGASAAPAPNTLSAFLDHVLTTARGTLLTRAGGGWVALAPGTAGYYLKTQGAGADAVWDSPAGSGTVTSVAAGTGLTTGGGAITGAGTVSLAAIANASVLANTSGASAAPVPTTTSLLFDLTLGATQGAVLYRSASAWVMLAPGTAGQILTTAGAAANPAWANAPAGAPIAAQRVLSNITGSTAAAIGNTLSDIFDSALGSSRGMIVYRGVSGWTTLAAGTAGHFLATGGPTGNPSWAAGGITGDLFVPGFLGSHAATGASVAPPSSADGWAIGSNYDPADIHGVDFWSLHEADPTNDLSSFEGGYTFWQSLSAAPPIAIAYLHGSPLFTEFDLYLNNGNDGTLYIGADAGGAYFGTTGFTGSPDIGFLRDGTEQIRLTATGPTAPTQAAGDSSTLIATTAFVAAQKLKYVVSAYVPGTMTANQNLLYHRFTKAITIPANLGAYLGHATQAGGSTNATLLTAIVLQKATNAAPTVFSTVATISIPPGTITPVLSTQAAISFAQGDVLRVRGPATPDTTFADFYMSLVGMET